MGIVNITPDSFYDGGKYKSDQAFLKLIETHLKEGASIIDIGAFSSRPGAKMINTQEETKRLVPIVQSVIETFPEVILSIDTYRSEVAKKVLEMGASIINDITGAKEDPSILNTCAQFYAPYIGMHILGNAETMHSNNTYNHLVADIYQTLEQLVNKAKEVKLNDLIIDLGFGFSKNSKQNFQLLKSQAFFQQLNTPILTGISRKSMIYKNLDGTPETALNGTTVLNTIALQNGANILRVHDVKEAMEAITLHKLYVNCDS